MQRLFPDSDRWIGPDLVITRIRIDLVRSQRSYPVRHTERLRVLPAERERPLVHVHRIDRCAWTVQGHGQCDRAISAAEVQDPWTSYWYRRGTQQNGSPTIQTIGGEHSAGGDQSQLSSPDPGR